MLAGMLSSKLSTAVLGACLILHKGTFIDFTLSFAFYSLSIVFLNNFYWSIVDFPIVLVSGVQQSESVIHIHISTLFEILCAYRSLQTHGKSSLE